MTYDEQKESLEIMKQAHKFAKEIIEGIPVTSIRFFLLGMDLGKYCKTENIEERKTWLRSNLDNGGYLADLISEAQNKMNKCSKCDVEYNSGDSFCSKCGNVVKTV